MVMSTREKSRLGDCMRERKSNDLKKKKIYFRNDILLIVDEWKLMQLIIKKLN